VGPYGQKLLGEMEEGKGSRNTTRVGTRQWRTVSSQLASNNLYSVLRPEKLGNKLNLSNTTERVRDVQCTPWPLWEVWIKVGLEKLKSHKEVAVKASSIYAMSHVGMMALTYSSTFHMSSLFTQIH